MALSGARWVVSALVVVLWQVACGWADGGAVASPSADAGLCLALALRWSGVSSSRALSVWVASLISAMVFQGAWPFWSFLFGWPVWSMLGDRFSGFTSLLLASACLSFCRSAGKLFVMGLELVPLTLSAPGLGGAMFAEAASSAFLLTLFLWLCEPESDR